MSEFLRGSFAILLFVVALLVYCFLPGSGADVAPKADAVNGAIDADAKLSASHSKRPVVEFDVDDPNGQSPDHGLLAHAGSGDAANALSANGASRVATESSVASTETSRSAGKSSLLEEDSLAGSKAVEAVEGEKRPARGGFLWWLLKLGLFLLILGWLLRWFYRWLTGSATASKVGSAGYESGRNDADLGRVYVQPPARVDDLTQIDGIDTAAAKRLNAAGIYQLGQLKGMSTSQREALQRKFNLPKLNWGNAGAVATGLGTAGAATLGAKSSAKPKTQNGAGRASMIQPGFSNRAAAKFAAETKTPSKPEAPSKLTAPSKSMKADTDFGQVYTTPPVDRDDLSKLEGIDKEMAARLNAAGIYKFDQLKNLTADQQSALQRRFQLPKLDGGKWNLAIPGLAAAAATIGGVAAAASAGAKGAASASATAAGKVVSVKASSSVTLKKPSLPTGKASVPAKGDDVREGQGGVPAGMKDDTEFGRIYLIPPKERDDLTQLDGIDKDAAARLNQAGIYTFEQLQGLSAHQQAAIQKRMKLPSVDFGKWKLAIPGLAAGTAALGAASAATKLGSDKSRAESGQGSSGRAPVLQGAMDHSSVDAFDGSPDEDAGESFCDASTRIDLDFGEVFINPPKDKDDLTQLAGVDEAVAAKMNAAGIYKFSQLRSLSPRQQASFKRRFGIPYGDWGSQIESSAGGKGGQVVGKPSLQKRGGKGIGPGFSSSGTPASSGKRPIGFAPRALESVDQNAPENQSVPENNFADDQERSRQVDSPGPLTKDTARIDRDLGFLYTSAPDTRDDLTRLKGVDAAMASKLNRAGIYKFEQIQSLTESQQASLAERFDLGNVDFDDWQRCVYAWGRGIDTSADTGRDYPKGKLHGIELPEVNQGVFDGDQLVAYPEQVIFRGEDPAGWGQDADAIRSDINYLRLRRTDTRESVVVPMTKAQIFANGDPAENGWNGSAEIFFGGRHVGVFGKDVPQEVETKFSQGGWGFGHRYDHNDRQEWGWEGRVIEPTTFEVSVGRIGEVPGTVVFRSADPGLWNTRTREGEFRMSDPISSVGHPINFVRIMREATGEAVIVPTTGGVLDEDSNPRCGWNGSNCVFTGGHHLGAYHVDLPQEAETKFGVGGWGFGHPYNDNDHQSWAWAGRQLPETVFEISVLESVPDFLAHELVS